jgi:DNA-binding response OmpR family regulator
MMQYEEMMRLGNHLEQLHDRADEYLHQLSNQRIITMMAAVLVAMLLILLIVIYRYFLQKARIADERNQMEREQLDFFTKVSHELRTPLTLIEGPLAQLGETKAIKDAGAEASGLFAIVNRNTHQLTELINKMLDAQVQNDLQKVALEQNDIHLTKGDERIDQQEAEPKVPEPSNSEQQPTVLIVDDNADIRAYLRHILQQHYQVNEASDGQQGLALANEIVPDLIVSDVMMPVMNGLEFCQRVKSSLATSHIPVILLTARALSQHQIEGYESGADAYITKPFSADLLLARISNLLKSRQLLKGLFGTENKEEVKEEAKEENKEKSPKTVQQPLTEKEDIFLTKFRDFIEKNLSDSDLGVETIGAELGLSRVQLYRKIKALTGLSPVELLRTARLQKGRQLLERTDKTISEVAYEVGFTAPSYFTKCFKDEFGISPSDL